MLAVIHSIFSSIKEKVNGIKARNNLLSKEISKDINFISTHLEIPKVSTVSCIKVISTSDEYCPQCSYYISGEKTINTYVSIEGPIYLSKEISLKNFRPMVKLAKILKCSKCGFVKYKKTMYIPLESVDIIEDFLPEDLRKTVNSIRSTTVTVEHILRKFIG